MCEHRGADDGMAELDRIPRAEQSCSDQRARRRQRGGRVERGQHGSQRQAGSVAEDRGGTEHLARLGRQLGEAGCDAAGDGLRGQRQDTWRVVGRQGDVQPLDRVEQRHQKEGVAARPVVERRGERRIRHPPEALRRDCRSRGLAEAGKCQQHGGRLCQQRAHELDVHCLLRRSRRDHEEERQPFEPTCQVVEPAKRRLVAPVHVVDDHERRVPERDVCGEPVQPVQHRERRVGRAPLARGRVPHAHRYSEGIIVKRSSLALVRHQFRYDLRAFRRNRQASLSTIALPVVLLVILVSSSEGETVRDAGHRVSLAQYLTPGLAAFAVVSAAFLSLVIDAVTQRESGALKRRRATPAPAWVLIVGRTLTAAAASLAVAFVLFAIAGNGYDVSVPSSGLPALAVTIVVGAIAFACVGYALSTAIRSAGAAQPVGSIVLLPFLLISGVLVPSGKLPHWLAAASTVFPLEHLASALRHAVDPYATGTRFAPLDLLVLVIWAVGAFVVAERRFSWLPERTL
jgi:ABC-2 type transport system permease protein